MDVVNAMAGDLHSPERQEIVDDPILTYFSQNLERISKEELLQALKGALESANYWREACLTGGFSTQTGVNVQSNPREDKNPGSSLPTGATNDRH